MSKHLTRPWILWLPLFLALPLIAREPLADRIGHTDQEKFAPQVAIHHGAGRFMGMFVLDSHALDANLQFVHRAIIEPKSSAGHHFHNTIEEMFVIFDGEAQFTIDGRTSLLKAPVAVLCPKGHSHAIYNPTDKPIQWLCIQVTSQKNATDAFDLNDPRTDVPLDPIPVFMNTRLDHSLLRAVQSMNGGKGTVQYKRALDPSVFGTPWAYVDQFVLPPSASIGAHLHREISEVYYVVKGQGTVTVSTQGIKPETALIHTGDAIPIQFGDIHSFENTGSEPLEFIVAGVARNMHKKIDNIDVRP